MSTRKVSGGKGSPGMAGGTYIRSAKKDVKAALKTAKKTKPLAEPKSAVSTIKSRPKSRPLTPIAPRTNLQRSIDKLIAARVAKGAIPKYLNKKKSK